jgi:hypothetical protein
MLGPCKQCGSSVSDQAERCPHCGRDHPFGAPSEAKVQAVRPRGWSLPLLIAAALLFGGGAVLYLADRQAAADWETVNSHSQTAIRQFISAHPIRFRRDAETALAALELEEQRYLSAIQTNSVAALEGFLREFPAGPHALAARERITELSQPPPNPCTRANVAWNTSVRQSCEIWDLEQFVQGVDRSCQVRLAALRRLQALRTEQSWRPTVVIGFTGHPQLSERPRLSGCVYD